MTEEVILRFYPWEIEELGLEYPEHIPVWLYNRLNEVEPAPPKDWRPLCFLTPRMTDLTKCRNWEQTNRTEPCLSCPYRKLEV